MKTAASAAFCAEDESNYFLSYAMHMTQNSFIDRIKRKTNNELDGELMSDDINDTGRQIVQTEILRRAVIEAAKPNRVAKWGLFIAVLSMVFAAIAAWPVIRDWFR